MNKTFLFILIALTYSSLALSQQAADSFAPETGDMNQASVSVQASEFIVAAAHPLATKAGYKVLKSGGNAMDAMITVQTVLGLVEPQSSGLGGGAFLVYWDAKKQSLTTFDARETAPLAVDESLFLIEGDTPMDFFEAVVGGRSVGVPGTPKLLWEMSKRYGSKKWSELLLPAIKLANEGFTVSPRLAHAVKRDEERLRYDETAYNYFFPGDKPINPGDQLINTDYANTLKLLSKQGGDHFYKPEFSQNIIDKVQSSKNKGYLSQKDFSHYAVFERSPVCIDYRQYEVCGMGPPSSGALSVNQTLGILENFDIGTMSPQEPLPWHLMSEASRLAFADRGAYIADTDFVILPDGLLDKRYLANRASLINKKQAAQQVVPGKPEVKMSYASSPERTSTTHFVIVDKEGNIVSMTSTIENGFGSRLMVNGFLLNNELTDFSFTPNKEGKTVANRVEARKRPRSSMAPTIVFKDKQPYLAIGSPGGSRIIPYVANSLISILDWKRSLKETFEMAHIVNRFGIIDLEKDTQAEGYKDWFESLGYSVSIRDLNSGLHGVRFTDQGMIGAADPRREGLVMGD